MTREYVLIGLGEFGNKTLETLQNLIDERRVQMSVEELKSAVPHFLSFENKDDFSFRDISNKITDAVRDSETRKNSGKFTYIIIGDLFDENTAMYATDYAIVPWALDRDKTLGRKEVLGFFTFSDEKGVTEKCSEESIALIRKFFIKLSDINDKNGYMPPFKDANGRDFDRVECTNGPFEKNYIVVTPGNSNAVINETSMVFAERLFYEIYKLADLYISNYDSNRNFHNQRISDEGRGKDFSTFSMTQVARLREYQEYYLKYTLENEILARLLREKLKETDLDIYFEKFLAMLDIEPKNKKFPVERAAELFYEKHRDSLESALKPKISLDENDQKNYLENCKANIENRIEEIRLDFDSFARDEVDYLIKALDKCITYLFRIDRIMGNMSVYIGFIEQLSYLFHSWGEQLKDFDANKKPYDIEKVLEKVREKMEELDKKGIYKIPFFTPVKRYLKSMYLKKLTVPLEKYMKSYITKRIVKSFLLYWESFADEPRHPVNTCINIKEKLEEMRRRLLARKRQVENKLKFIQEVNSYYYVISPMNREEYEFLLKRIRERNFGSAKQTELDKTAKNVFKLWTGENDLATITGDPIKFVSEITKFANDSFVSYNEVEHDNRKVAEYAASAKEMAIRRAEQNVSKSFNVDNESYYLGKAVVMLKPELQEADDLENQLSGIFGDGTENVTLPKDFTLGATVFFNDYLYMSLDGGKEKSGGLQKNVMLEKYKDVKTREPKYSGKSTDETASLKDSLPDADLNTRDKYVRALLNGKCSELLRKVFYKRIFGKEISDKLSREQINAVAHSVKIKDVLNELEFEDLEDYARDIGALLDSDKETLIENIEIEISRK